MPTPAVDSPASSAVQPGLRVAMVIQRFRPEFSGQGIQLEQLCHALARRGLQNVPPAYEGLFADLLERKRA